MTPPPPPPGSGRGPPAPRPSPPSPGHPHQLQQQQSHAASTAPQLQFVVHPLPGSQEQLFDKLRYVTCLAKGSEKTFSQRFAATCLRAPHIYIFYSLKNLYTNDPTLTINDYCICRTTVCIYNAVSYLIETLLILQGRRREAEPRGIPLSRVWSRQPVRGRLGLDLPATGSLVFVPAPGRSSVDLGSLRNAGPVGHGGRAECAWTLVVGCPDRGWSCI